jgi:hypothetical protein
MLMEEEQEEEEEEAGGTEDVATVADAIVRGGASCEQHLGVDPRVCTPV